jgi:predicted transcriptional regulator
MAKSQAEADPVLAELTAIKRLIIFSLLKSGTSQEQIAQAIGSSQAQISRMFTNDTGKRSRGKSKRK